MNIENEKVFLIVDYLKEKLSANLIVIYGLSAELKEDGQQGVDVAFLSKKQYTGYDMFMLSQMLSELTGRDTTLVDINTVSTVLQMQILSFGKIVYCDDELLKREFTMNALKRYARLSEERECILSRIIERGREDEH